MAKVRQKSDMSVSLMLGLTIGDSAVGVDNLLLEDGDNLLLEDGSVILLQY